MFGLDIRKSSDAKRAAEMHKKDLKPFPKRIEAKDFYTIYMPIDNLQQINLRQRRLRYAKLVVTLASGEQRVFPIKNWKKLYETDLGTSEKNTPI